MVAVESLCRNKGGTISRMRSTFSTNASSQAVKQIRPPYIRGVRAMPRTSTSIYLAATKSWAVGGGLVTDTNGSNAVYTWRNLFMASSGKHVFADERQISSRDGRRGKERKSISTFTACDSFTREATSLCHLFPPFPYSFYRRSIFVSLGDIAGVYVDRSLNLGLKCSTK